jgi:lipopolysaccharide heptosyltransferase II
MDVDFQRKIDRYLGAFICRVLSLFDFQRGKETRAVNPKRILVILLSEMGSLVLAYPMFQRLTQKYPDAELHVLLFEKNREVLELMQVLPGDRILTISDRSFAGLAADGFRILRRMRHLKFDIVIDCELFARISSILSFFSGAEIRVGFHPYTQEGLYRGSFINRPVLYNPYQHLSRQFLALAASIESSKVPTSKFAVADEILQAPLVEFDAAEIKDMKARLDRDFPAIAGKQLILLYPGGGILPIRAWPLDYYCQLAGQFVADGYAVAVIGLQSDGHLARQIMSYCRDASCFDLTGYTQSIRELMLIFHLSALLITNDGGPGQFAAMTPIPAIIFYGPETPALYAPHSQNAEIFFASLACSPCVTAYNHRNSPCDGDNQCLKVIKPQQVLEKARQLLAHENSRSASV